MDKVPENFSRWCPVTTGAGSNPVAATGHSFFSGGSVTRSCKPKCLGPQLLLAGEERSLMNGKMGLFKEGPQV